MDRKISPQVALIAVFMTALLAQLFGHYFASSYLRIADRFFGLWVLLRIVIPAAVVIWLAIPFSQLFLGRPQWSKSSKRAFIGGLVIVAGILVFLQFFGDSYLGNYRRHPYADPWAKFQGFLIFTSSTMIGWELLHRCFLLGGLRYCLHNRLKVDAATASLIAVLFTCAFEVIFHLKKPIYESLGLVLASPFFCWLTLTTRSVWPALILHLCIEVAFAYTLYFG